MLEKWQRGPQKIGMVVGFVMVPVLWFIQDFLLNSLVGLHWSPNSELIDYFAVGAIPGAVLGAGVSKSILAMQRKDRSDAKCQLIGHGGAVLVLSALVVWGNWRFFLSPYFFLFLPLHLAFLMFFLGILMRSRR